MRVSLIFAALSLASVAFATQDDRVTPRGKIVHLPGDDMQGEEPIRFESESGETFDLVLEPDNFYAIHDKLLEDRIWEFEGFVKGDQLEVQKMFTIKDGHRHDVTYYCEICHIVSHRPGRCMCCQEHVELQETKTEE